MAVKRNKFLNFNSDKLLEFSGGIILLSLLLGFGFMVSHHKNVIEKRYGFCTMTPDIQYTPCHIEPIMIRCVTPGGIFDKAGFRDRDILISPEVHTVSAFLKFIDKPTGTIIEIIVIPFNKFKPDCDSDDWGEKEIINLVAP